jgi:Endonuclease/Exonuclease/phosphatase family
VIGNHWPARSAGVYESEPYWILAAETLSYWHERIMDNKGADMPVVAMGDFNDEPFNRSLVDYALSTLQATKVLNTRLPRFFNLMWPLHGERLGTHYFENFRQPARPVPGLAALARARRAAARRSGERAHRSLPGDGGPGRRSRAAPLRAPEQRLRSHGFSDHYPIAVMLHEN